MYRNILIAHDGSEGAQKAFDAAVELASQLQAQLHMISVEEYLPCHTQTIGEVQDEKDLADSYFIELGAQCKRRAALKGVKLECTIKPGHEVKAIVEFTREGNFDLLLVGFTGHSMIYEHLWGGTSQNLTRLSPCPVLVVK